MDNNIHYVGEKLSLYIKYLDEEKENVYIENSKVRILHVSGENVYEVLEWTNMDSISNDEFLYTYSIPLDSKLGCYYILYHAEYENKTAEKMEIINIISKNPNYENPIKVFGYVENIKDNSKIQACNIEIMDNTYNQSYVTETNIDGYWEAYIYPNKYTISFNKNQFISKKIEVNINEELQEQLFETIGLNLANDPRGNGVFKISETLTSKFGTPLYGLNISLFDILNPKSIIASDVTNNNGEFSCFLNEGSYILKANGVSMGIDYNKTFKLKVDVNGEYSLVDLSKNTAMITNVDIITNGNGLITVTDYIKDNNGIGIVDVQVNILKGNDILAQDYTNMEGKWTLKLDPGVYDIEYYHPKFKTIVDKIIVT